MRNPGTDQPAALLDRLEYVRGLGIDSARARRIHPARLGRLLAELEARLADATLAMFEKYIGSLFSKAQNRDERRFQATKRDVAKALLLFRRTIAGSRRSNRSRMALRSWTARSGCNGWTTPCRSSAHRSRALLGAAPVQPRFLAAFRFDSNVPHDLVLAAIEVLKTMDRDGARTFPRAPPGVLPASEMAQSFCDVCWDSYRTPHSRVSTRAVVCGYVDNAARCPTYPRGYYKQEAVKLVN